MSITSLNFVVSQFEVERYRYFIIYDEDNDVVFTQNELVDQETAIVKLRSFFKDNNGFFTIKVFGKKLTNSKSKIEQDKNLVTKFNIELTSSMSTQQNNGVGNLQSALPQDDPRNNAPNIYELFGRMGDVTTQMKLMEKDHAHYRETKDLQDRITKMEEESAKNKGMNGVVSTLGEHFKDPSVLLGLVSGVSGLFKKQEVVAMNGVSEEVANNISTRRAKLTDSVNLLMKLDTNFAENISSLATLCANNPDMYKMAVNYLKNLT